MRSRLLVNAGKMAAVVLILGWSTLPIIFIVLSSLKPGRDIFAVPPKFIFDPTIQHYVESLGEMGDVLPGVAEQPDHHRRGNRAGNHGKRRRRLCLFALPRPFPGVRAHSS